MNAESISRIDNAFGDPPERQWTANIDMRHQHKLGNGCYYFHSWEAQPDEEFIEGVHHWAD